MTDAAKNSTTTVDLAPTRIVLHNPDCSVWFGTPVYSFLRRSRSVRKYVYLLVELRRRGRVYVYVDNTDSSFPASLRRRVPRWLEFYCWLLVNGLNPFAVTRLGKGALRKDDVFVSFIYGNFALHGRRDLDASDLVGDLATVSAIKVFHATHFVYDIAAAAARCRESRVDFIVAENNLYRNSAFFAKYYGWYRRDVYTLPAGWQPRFNRTRPFEARALKAVATGTITYPITDPAFVAHFHTTSMHPLRREIFVHRERLAPYIESFISDVTEGKSAAKWLPSDSWLKRLGVRLRNAFTVKQSDYFRFDIVEEYNRHAMFVVPEEVNDLPGIGFVEGMACGCAYIGQAGPMYSDIGLVAGEHYIGHDGTLEGLVAAITHYQAHPDELARIAESGYRFVRERLSGEAVARRFIDDLARLAARRATGDTAAEFDCSFRVAGSSAS